MDRGNSLSLSQGQSVVFELCEGDRRFSSRSLFVRETSAAQLKKNEPNMSGFAKSRDGGFSEALFESSWRHYANGMKKVPLITWFYYLKIRRHVSIIISIYTLRPHRIMLSRNHNHTIDTTLMLIKSSSSTSYSKGSLCDVGAGYRSNVSGWLEG